MINPTPQPTAWQIAIRPFQKATIRGLAVVLPPLLTIVLFIWAWNTVDRYILGPIEATARSLIVWRINESLPDEDVRWLVQTGQGELQRSLVDESVLFTTPSTRQFTPIKKNWIPVEVFEFVESLPDHAQAVTANDYYNLYVQNRFLQRRFVLPAFLAIFIAVLYLVGKLFAVGLGRLLWSTLEALINRIPIIRNVYSSVKQVTDFAFNESEIQFTRVVAVEYPRPGIWSIGFQTGEGLQQLVGRVQEPMINVLMPTSPMPATGFTISVPKSQAIELDMTIDQAVQYCVSCGVVTPLHQQLAGKKKLLTHGKTDEPLESSKQ